MTFFKTIDDLKSILPVDISQRAGTIFPYIVDAHHYISDVIGIDTFNTLLEYYNAETPEPNDNYDKIIDLIQKALSRFGYFVAFPFINVIIHENGVGIVSTQNIAPASKERTDAARTAFEIAGYDRLEDIIIFIEKNKTAFSNAYYQIFTNRFFINSATELNSILQSNFKHIDFLPVKPHIFLYENTEIIATVGETLFDTLKSEYKAQTYTGNNKNYIDKYIRPAVACWLYNRIKTSPHHETEATRYLARLREQIAADSNETVTYYQNTAESKIVHLGC